MNIKSLMKLGDVRNKIEDLRADLKNETYEFTSSNFIVTLTGEGKLIGIKQATDVEFIDVSNQEEKLVEAINFALRQVEELVLEKTNVIMKDLRE